jgi:hypothetical protein
MNEHGIDPLPKFSLAEFGKGLTHILRGDPALARHEAPQHATEPSPNKEGALARQTPDDKAKGKKQSVFKEVFDCAISLQSIYLLGALFKELAGHRTATSNPLF